MSERLFTLKEAAVLLSCSYSFLWRQVKKGVLPCIRLGDGLRIAESDLTEFLAARRSKPKN